MILQLWVGANDLNEPKRDSPTYKIAPQFLRRHASLAAIASDIAASLWLSRSLSHNQTKEKSADMALFSFVVGDEGLEPPTFSV